MSTKDFKEKENKSQYPTSFKLIKVSRLAISANINIVKATFFGLYTTSVN